MRVRWSAVAAASALALAAAGGAPARAGAEEKAVFGVPGIPPVFGSVVAFVAEKEGFFKKRGVDGAVRPFDSGAAASRAVAAGDIDMALSPTPLVVNQISNSDVKLVAIYGLENPDWLVASTDPALAGCKDLKGKAIGVESIGGARSLALKEMLVPCGLKLDDVQQVALGTNVDAAMIAGQLQVGVLHLDDVPGIEARAPRPPHTVVTLRQSTPVSHYLVLVVNQERLAKNRSLFVRMLAGLIDAQAFMAEPANAARVAQIAAPTGRPPPEAEKALRTYLAMEFWPRGHVGLTRAHLESVIAKQVAIGGIRPDRKPVTPERLADPSVWQEALALTRAR